MALSFITDKTPVNLLKVPFEQVVRPLRPRFDSVSMEDSLAAEQMKVYLRVRPFTEDEISENENQNCFNIESGHTIVARSPSLKGPHVVGKVSHKYTFNAVMGPECKQTDVFNQVVRDPLKGFIEGRNALVFTYGITSSGKTYTVQGPSNAIGILPRALDMIFNTINKNLHSHGKVVLAPQNFDEVVKMKTKDYDAILKQKDDLTGFQTTATELDGKSGPVFSSGESDALSVTSHDSLESSSSMAAHFAHLAQILSEANKRERDESVIQTDVKTDMRYSIWISYAEIYNEYIYDLFTPIIASGKSASLRSNQAINSKGTTKGIRRPSLELRMDKRGSIYIRGLRCFPVTSADDAYRLLLIGRQNQQMASTRLNLTSSRSHTIFSVHAIRCSEKAQPQFARVSTMTFCDLAGSERTLKTGNVGDRLREAGNINTSLLTLGRCIQTLRNNQMNPDRPLLVPYRESKLTRLFQNFFTGKGKACMLVNINQLATMFDETLHVLKFSAVAKQVVVQQQTFPLAPIAREQHGNNEEEARRSRFKSLGLRTPRPGTRVSIAWENTPLSCANTTNLHSILFTGNEGTLVEEQMENTMTSIAEETAIEYDTEELLAIIEDLRQQLVETKKECIRIESKVREDVCREMDDLVLTLEARHEEALREQETYMQEQSDRRIQLYLNSICNSSKRARIMSTSDEMKEVMESHDPTAESMVLKNKIEDCEAELSDLRSQCSDLREALSHVTLEKDELTLTVTRLQFQAGLNDHETAQRKLKDEEKIKVLEMQLQKLMTQTKDESHISDLDCQIDQSRIIVIPKSSSNDSSGEQVLSDSVSLKSNQGKKKVFSPILPKRSSDEADKHSAWEKTHMNEATPKANVFSPLLSQCVNQDIELDDSEFRCDTPALETVVKKNPSSLISENIQLKSKLKKLQEDLTAAEEARKTAESNLNEARQEFANGTAGMGSFLRHEAEADFEEQLDKKTREIAALKVRLRETESTLRDLEMRNVANYDAFTEEKRQRQSLSSRYDRLEKECHKQIEELQRERRRHEGNVDEAVQEYKSKLEVLSAQIQLKEDEKKENLRIIDAAKKERREFESKYIVERKAVTEHIDQIDKLQASLKRMEQTCKENSDKLSSLTKEKNQIELKLDAERESKNASDAQLRTLRSNVENLKDEMASLSVKNRKLEMEIDCNRDMKSELENERTRCQMLSKANQEIKMSLGEVQHQYAAAEETVKVREKEIQKYQSNIKELTAKYREAETNARFRDKVKALEASEISLKKTINHREDDIRQMKKKLNQIESEMDSCITQNNCLKEKCSEYEKEIHILKEKENESPEGASSVVNKERRTTSKTRGTLFADVHLKKNVTEDDRSTTGCGSRRVTRSMRPK